MSLRLFVPLLPGVAYVSKGKEVKRLERAANQPQLSPERAAEVRHETAMGRWWVLFACLAVPSFAIAGPTAMWWLLPIGMLIGFAHVVRARFEATATPEQLAREQATREVHAVVSMGPDGCTVCGNPKQHRDPQTRRPQHPRDFHAAEVAARIEARTAAIVAASQ